MIREAFGRVIGKLLQNSSTSDDIDASATSQKSVEVVDRLSKSVDDGSTQTIEILERIEEALVQIADNVYNIAGKLNAQVSSMGEVSAWMAKDRAERERGKSEGELSAIEAAREAEKDPKATPTSRLASLTEEAMEAINDALGWFKLLSKILIPALIGVYIGVRDKIEEVFGEFGVFFADIGAWLIAIRMAFGKKVFEPFRKVGAWAKEFFKGFSVVDDALRPVMKILPKLGRIIGKAFLPLTVLLGAFDAISGAIEGYEKEGIAGAVKGAFGGIISGLIGWIGDLASWLWGSLLEVLGFEELGKSIKEIDFTKAINDLIQTSVGSLIELVQTFFGSIAEGFGKILDGDFSGLLDIVGAPFKSLYAGIKELFGFDPVESLKKSFLTIAPPGSFLDYIIPDSVYEYLGATKKEPEPLTGPQMATAKEVAQKLLMSYAPPGSWASKLIPDSVYEAAGIDPVTGALEKAVSAGSTAAAVTGASEKATRKAVAGSTATTGVDFMMNKSSMVVATAQVGSEPPRAVMMTPSEAAVVGGTLLSATPITGDAASAEVSVMRNGNWTVSKLADVKPGETFRPSEKITAVATSRASNRLGAIGSSIESNAANVSFKPISSSSPVVVSAPSSTNVINSTTAVTGQLAAVGSEFGAPRW